MIAAFATTTVDHCGAEVEYSEKEKMRGHDSRSRFAMKMEQERGVK